jgi:hypothetical protein
VRCVNANSEQVGSSCSKTGKTNARKHAQKQVKAVMTALKEDTRSVRGDRVCDIPSHPSMHKFTDPLCEEAGPSVPGTFVAQAMPELFATPDE